MKLVFLSEHYEPRVGGVTSVVNSLCRSIKQLGHDIWLVVPGGHDNGVIVEKKIDFGHLISVGTGLNLTGQIPSKTRIEFSERASDWIRVFSSRHDILAVHILYGLYLMKYLDLRYLKDSVYRGCTIHNIPPQECATSWAGDSSLRFWKDLLRQKLVGYVNKRRIKSQAWTSYIVPSHYVAKELSKVINPNKVHVIGHGVQEVNKRPGFEKPLKKNFRFLTVSGFTPHKSLEIIPSIIKQLVQAGLDVRWDVVGPNKNEHYVNELIKERALQNVMHQLNFHFSVKSVELAEFFEKADVYIHPSKEEGFCLAVLEAATYGLPIIGRPTGAIPEIIESGKGELFENDGELNSKILEVVKNLRSYHYSTEDFKKLGVKFNWRIAAQKYLDIFQQNINS